MRYAPSYYKKMPEGFVLQAFSRGEKTRTSGLYVPNVARYQLRHTPSVLRLQKYTFFEIKMPL